MEAEQRNLFIGLAQPNTENMRGNFMLVDFDIIDEDQRHDLSLLHLRRNPFRGDVSSGFRIKEREIPLLLGTPIFNPIRPRDGVAVGISGYPFDSPFLITNAGAISSSWAINVQVVAQLGAPEWFRFPDIADIYLADIEINPGNSGGPVYLLEDASVIGVCIGSRRAPVRDQHDNNAVIEDTRLFYSSGLTLVVPSRYLIELLRSNDLRWSEIEYDL